MGTFEASIIVQQSSWSSSSRTPPPRSLPELEQADWRDQQEQEEQRLQSPLAALVNDIAASVSTQMQAQVGGATAAVKRSGDASGEATDHLPPCLAAVVLKSFANEKANAGVHHSRYVSTSLCEGMCGLRRAAVWLAVLVAWSVFSVAEAGCAITPNTTTGNVVIPDAWTIIANNAFYQCPGLKTVTFGKGRNLTTIGTSAFFQTGLTTLAIPDSVTVIGKQAFQSCTALKTVTFGTGSNLTTIGNQAFQQSGLTTLAIPKPVTMIANAAFYQCYSLKTVTFGTGSNLASIGTNVFGNSGLTTLAIPDSVTVISGTAFQYCGALTTVTFGAGSRLTSIGNNAFVQSGLTTLSIPDSVTTIFDNAFDTCTALKTVTFGTSSTLTTIGDSAFTSSGLTAITIPDSVTAIADNAFLGCAFLTTATFGTGSHLTSIGTSAFQSCAALTTVTFGARSRLATIGTSAFQSSGLQAITIPPSVTVIGNSAFESCNALLALLFICGTVANIGQDAFLGIGMLSVQLPPTVICNGCGIYSVMQCTTCANVDINGNVLILSTITSIGPNAFNDCKQLTSVTFELDGSQLASIYDGAFSNTGIASLTLPQSLQTIGSRAFSGCKNLESVSFFGTSQLGVIGVEAFAGSGLASFAVPLSTKQIQQHAFANSTSLLTGRVSIPCGCNMTLEGNVFAGSKVTSIALPSTSICVNRGALTIIALACVSCANVNPEGYLIVPANVTSISSGSFRTCASLTTIAFEPGSQLASISSDAFRSCPNLRSISSAIPKSVTAIGDRAFYNCTKLTIVDFEAGSGLQTIGQNAFQQTALQAIRLPETLRVISDGAFSGSNVTSVVFQNSSVSQLSSIGDFAFQLCPFLTAISIPASVVSIGSGTFRLCGELQSVVFESGSRLQSIGANAFQSTSVSSMSLPAILTSIGSYAFYDCLSLSSVVLDCGSNVAIAENAFFSSSVQAISLTRGSSCLSCGAAVAPVALTCTPSQSPTQAPTVLPEINVDRRITFDVSAKTIQQVAIAIALLSAALGAYYVNLRKADKSVAVVSMPSVAILTGLIGGEVVTSVALLADIFHSKYSGWGFVIAAMRLGHMLIATFILYSIFGSASARACTGLYGYLASDHMLQNRKMYALASIFTVFNIGAFIMLPWKTSPFAAKAQGLPSPAMFRMVHRTEIITAVLSILAQVPYLSNKNCADNANCIENVTFFYANIALRSLQLLVAVVTYIMCAGLLEGTATSLDVDASKDSLVDKGTSGGGGDGDDVEMNAIATRNPINPTGNSTESSATANSLFTRVAHGQEEASENESARLLVPLTRKVVKVEGDVRGVQDLQEQFKGDVRDVKGDVRDLQEQFKQMLRRLDANESSGVNSHAQMQQKVATADTGAKAGGAGAAAVSSDAHLQSEQHTGLVSLAIKKFSGGDSGNSK